MLRWTEEKALESLRKSGAVVQGKAIAPATATGIRLWGAIDFLVHFKGYRVHKG